MDKVNRRVRDMRHEELVREQRLVREMRHFGLEQAVASRAKARALNHEKAAEVARKARKQAASRRDAERRNSGA